MSEHTKEPWSVSTNEYDGNAIHGPKGEEICWGYHEDFGRLIEAIKPENARRIVACVNACAAVSNIYLEAVAETGGIAALEAEKHKWMVSAGICERQVNELAEINKELLAILKKARKPLADDCISFSTFRPLVAEIDAAIARAEQQ